LFINIVQVYLVPVGATLFEKAEGYVASNRIGMKLGLACSSSKYASIDGVGFLM